MGNSCLFPGSTTINASRISTVFLVQSPGSSAERSRYRTFSKKRRNGKVAPRHHNNGEDSRGSSTTTPIGQQMNIMMHSQLTPRDKQLIEQCWRDHIRTGRRDLFHRTMLFCIEASPKMNEIIACGRYCYRDLTKWPKLNRICVAQFNFFEKLIFEYDMEEWRMHEACVKLGEMHANFAQFGLKAHFLDIYQQQLLALIAKLEVEDKVETCIAFTHLTSFVIDVMIHAYSQKVSTIRHFNSLSIE